MKVAIVEDQFIEAFDLQLILEHNGYTVTGIAHTANEGLELIRNTKPDLVCLDIMLKGKQNGIMLAEMLNPMGIGFVFISATSYSTVANTAIRTGPYGFITKPFQDQDVLPVIASAFAQLSQKG